MNSNINNNVLSRDFQIFYYKSKILEKLKFKQVLIIVGQTGCGKSTQVPQYLYQSGYSNNGIIACLHPRRIAAMTLAERVSYETKTALGTLVGYRVRFDSVCSYDTKIVYMTTGYMLRILQENEAINCYSVVIIDEAHERSVQNDLLMGKMKIIMKNNKFIKLVIMSATLNVEEIEKYYPGSETIHIIEFNSRVEIIYRPLKNKSYVLFIKDIVKEILESSQFGHILIFLPTEQKVRKCKKLLKEFKEPIILSFYSAMDDDDKMTVFKEFRGRRKIIVATNVAETSLTIKGIDFVIDSGFVKRVQYDYENMVERWITEPISIAEANQRTGRTGRTGFGKCYRLYEDPKINEIPKFNHKSKESFMYVDMLVEQEEKRLQTKTKQNSVNSKIIRPKFPIPEIKNVNLGPVILSLKCMGIQDINSFPFIVMPDAKSLERSIFHLKELSLLNHDETINKLGKEVSILPLDSSMGKVAVIGSQLACRADVFSVISLLNVTNIFKSPTGKLSKECHEKFYSKHGDLFCLLNLYKTAMIDKFSKAWCKENFINFSSLKYAAMITRQLTWLLPPPKKIDADLSKSIENQIKKAFLSGFFHNISYPVNNVYQTCGDKRVIFYEGSCLKDCNNVVSGITMLYSLKTKDYVLRNIISLNEDMLKAFNPKKYKVKTTLWKEVMKKLEESRS